MKIVIIAVAALVALAAVVTVAGLLMPRQHVASTSVTLKQPVDSVWPVLRDIGAMPSWWSDVKLSERVSGGAGERWRQKAGGNDMQYDVIESVPPFRFTMKIVEEKGAPFGGVWTYVLEPASGGTTVTITENGWIGPPPFRVIARLMGQHRTADRMLRALGKRFSEDVTPVHR